jgi:hypothetical protein
MTITEMPDLESLRLALLEANLELDDAQKHLAETIALLDQRDRSDKIMITAAMRTSLARVVEAQRKLQSLGLT